MYITCNNYSPLLLLGEPIRRSDRMLHNKKTIPLLFLGGDDARSAFGRE